MPLNLSEDIRSVTDLKRKTKEILNQVHRTKRPVVLTLNGKADAVLMDTTTYEKHLKASNMAPSKPPWPRPWPPRWKNSRPIISAT